MIYNKKYLYELFQLFRIKQYAKNGFVFIPLFFSGGALNIQNLTNVFFAFVLFSLMASSIYILNDYLDIEVDRLHPKKKNRPLVTGSIDKNFGLLLSLLLSCSSIILSLLLNNSLTLVLLFYLFTNILYSMRLKHVPIIDVFILALGFILRLFAGSVVADVKLSIWLQLMTFLLSLFLGFAKRRDDFILSDVESLSLRKVNKYYNLKFIDSVLSILVSITVVCYIFYCLSDEVTARYSVIITLPSLIFVLFGLFRYLQITLVENNSGSPAELLYTDRPLSISVFLWLVYFLCVIYL